MNRTGYSIETSINAQCPEKGAYYKFGYQITLPFHFFVVSLRRTTKVKGI